MELDLVNKLLQHRLQIFTWGGGVVHHEGGVGVCVHCKGGGGGCALGVCTLGVCTLWVCALHVGAFI